MDLKGFLQLYHRFPDRELDIDPESVRSFQPPSSTLDRKYIADLYGFRYKNYSEKFGEDPHYSAFVNNLAAHTGNKIHSFLLMREHDMLIIVTDEAMTSVIGVLQSHFDKPRK
jgi:hypothetical protein